MDLNNINKITKQIINENYVKVDEIYRKITMIQELLDDAYVAEAKKELYGEVGIDSFAGPSEILVIADTDANPKWIAADLFSQAEHDELAQAVLISPDQNLLDKVEKIINETISAQKRKEIIKSSLENFGLLIK